jgi:hypothetical protein
MTETLAKSIILLGLLITLAGVALYALSRSEINVFQWLGKLPLNIKIERENFTFYFPLGASILLSILATLILHLYRKLSE